MTRDASVLRSIKAGIFRHNLTLSNALAIPVYLETIASGGRATRSIIEVGGMTRLAIGRYTPKLGIPSRKDIQKLETVYLKAHRLTTHISTAAVPQVLVVECSFFPVGRYTEPLLTVMAIVNDEGIPVLEIKE